MKSVAQWGRGNGSKRRKAKRERDGISRAVGGEKQGRRRKRRKKKEKKLSALWGRGDVGKRKDAGKAKKDGINNLRVKSEIES